MIIIKFPRENFSFPGPFGACPGDLAVKRANIKFPRENFSFHGSFGACPGGLAVKQIIKFPRENFSFPDRRPCGK
jgi:hypothetical protein